ncbi:hypothetical protein [Ramlibacter tataouinensis]|nr:hypothetical protein [Ramlibacter tataouinensis]
MAAWLIFAAGTALLLGSLWVLGTNAQEAHRAELLVLSARAARDAESEEQRNAQTRASDPQTRQRVKEEERLRQMTGLRWFEVLDVLENAAHQTRSGVTLLSLAPEASERGEVQLRLEALAASAPLMLRYVRALQSDPRVSHAELTMHEPDESLGRNVLRFQIELRSNAPSILKAD